MKAMTWEEIDKDWGGLQKRHRMEIAQAVARYCVGHKMSEVAERLKQSIRWLQSKLDMAGVSAAIGESGGPPTLVGKHRGLQEDCERIVRKFEPNISLRFGGVSKDTVEVEGKDADAFQPYLDHYIQQNHEPAAAIRLAKAEWAAEEAVNAGVIKEDVNKRNEKVNRILFPEDAKDTFELDLKMHMARVKAAAKFLDQAKMNFLRRKSTCEMVESANEAWVEQVDRVLTNHPNHR
jgi:hypothetical protein